MIAGLATLYGWTPDYVLSRLTTEDAIAFLDVGVRLASGTPRPDPPRAVAPVADLTGYQAPDRAGFARKARGK